MQPRALRPELVVAIVVSSALVAASGCGSTVERPSRSDDDGTGSGGGSTVGVVVSAGVGPDAGSGSLDSSLDSSGPGASPTTSGMRTCDAPQVFPDLDLQACVGETCCDEMTVCGNDPNACFGRDGLLDTSLPGGAALDDCIGLTGCISGGFDCNDVGFLEEALEIDGATVDCLGENCCSELNYCTDNGRDVEGCIDCFFGEHGERCDPVNFCADANCDAPLYVYGYCDSGLGSLFEDIGACVTDNCCDPYVECTGGVDDDGSPLDADQYESCIDCFDSGGTGAACAPALTCVRESCDTRICDSGISIPNLELAACLSTNCCAEYNDCTSAGEDPETCLDCMNSDGGQLCDAAIACEAAECSGE